MRYGSIYSIHLFSKNRITILGQNLFVIYTHNVMAQQLITFADFFAGIGGFRLGLERLGWQCVYSNEIDQFCVQTYNQNFNEKAVASPVENVNAAFLPDFDVFCGGFPCQPFSIAGKKKALQDKRGNAINEIKRICSIKRPKSILLENVPNIARLENGRILQHMYSEFRSIGYDCYHAVIDSKHFGVPQSRPRLYFVGIRNDIDSFGFDFEFVREREVPVKNIIESGDNSIPISDKWKQYIEYYAGRKSKSDLSFDLPTTRIAIERSDIGVDLDNCIYQMRSSGIRAISLNRPFPTFAVSISGGGAMIPVYSKEKRHLSILEIKRLMGFPDNFKFTVSRTHAIKQLANAVCPQVITNIGINLSTYL